METLQNAVDQINSALWTWILVVLLLGTGLYFTIRTRAIQVRQFPKLFRALGKSRTTSEDGISSFEAFATSLAARVGTGNIAGVAVALSIGGPGAIFWMWVVAALGMATSLAECTLAQVFKHRDDEGLFRGGPAYYIERGLGKRWLGIAFALMLVFAYGVVFGAVQSNSIADATTAAFSSIPLWSIAVVVGVMTLGVISGGLRRVSRTAEIIVPVMAVTYVAMAFYVLVTNIGQVPGELGTIVHNAFGLHEIGGGGLGAALAIAVQQGSKRGLFSNEAGLGSSPNAAATAVVSHPGRQGYVQALGVFFDTIVICTSTALMILLSGVYQPGKEVQGVKLTQQALASEVGSWGTQFIAIALMFFAFSTIIANYSYCETNLFYVFKQDSTRKVAILVLKVVVVGMVVFGVFGDLPLVWSSADVAAGGMALLNLTALLLLSPIALKVIRDYQDKLKTSDDPVFDPNFDPEVAALVDPEVWGGASTAKADTSA